MTASSRFARRATRSAAVACFDQLFVGLREMFGDDARLFDLQRDLMVGRLELDDVRFRRGASGAKRMRRSADDQRQHCEHERVRELFRMRELDAADGRQDRPIDRDDGECTGQQARAEPEEASRDGDGCGERGEHEPIRNTGEVAKQERNAESDRGHRHCAQIVERAGHHPLRRGGHTGLELARRSCPGPGPHPHPETATSLIDSTRARSDALS